jgi:hypothetical protein
MMFLKRSYSFALFFQYSVLFPIIATESYGKITGRQLPDYGLNPPPPVSKECDDFFADDCPQDCDLLLECKWPGFNASNLGDG